SAPMRPAHSRASGTSETPPCRRIASAAVIGMAETSIRPLVGRETWVSRAGRAVGAVMDEAMSEGFGRAGGASADGAGTGSAGGSTDFSKAGTWSDRSAAAARAISEGDKVIEMPRTSMRCPSASETMRRSGVFMPRSVGGGTLPECADLPVQRLDPRGPLGDQRQVALVALHSDHVEAFARRGLQGGARAGERVEHHPSRR